MWIFVRQLLGSFLKRQWELVLCTLWVPPLILFRMWLFWLEIYFAPWGPPSPRWLWICHFTFGLIPYTLIHGKERSFSWLSHCLGFWYVELYRIIDNKSFLATEISFIHSLSTVIEYFHDQKLYYRNETKMILFLIFNF